MSTNTRQARYRRHIEGADFSLEANTDLTPEDSGFYVIRGGEVLLQSHSFQKAEAAYLDLCREFWLRSLTSESAAGRMSGAWGLLGLEPAHKGAAAVIDRDGDEQDRARLARIVRQHSLQPSAAEHPDRRAGRKRG